MDLKTAQEQFTVIMQKLILPDLRKSFLSWIQENWPKESKICSYPEIYEYNDKDIKLRKISEDLRQIVPLNAILPSENINFPSIGENADCDPSHTLHVDAFLYDEDMIDELCDTGELARNYCIDCSSHNTQPITYISHSCSRERLTYIFHALLPPLPEKVMVLDVGSRLGAVLYGAYVHTKCQRIVGIELNPDLCHVQQKIIEKYSMQDRVQLICGDVANHGETVVSADVIILNNVFEFFSPPDIQLILWTFLRHTARKGSLIVSIPSLQDSVKHLDINFLLEEWVKEMPAHDPNVTAPFDFQSETSDVKLYQVL